MTIAQKVAQIRARQAAQKPATKPAIPNPIATAAAVADRPTAPAASILAMARAAFVGSRDSLEPGPALWAALAAAAAAVDTAEVSGAECRAVYHIRHHQAVVESENKRGVRYASQRALNSLAKFCIHE